MNDSGQKHQSIILQTAHCLPHDNKTFLKTLCVEFQYLPRNNGRHLPKIPPPLRKKKKKFNNREIPPLAPSAKPTTQRRQTGRNSRKRKRGRCDGEKGVRRGGGSSDGQGGRRQNNRRGKVTKSRANGKTLTIDMNEDVPIVSRDEEKSSQLAFFFFSQGTSTVLDSHALLSNKADYTSLHGRGVHTAR